MPTSDDINAALEDATQAVIKNSVRRAHRDGRNMGPDMFAPEHSTYKKIEGIAGAGTLFVREDRHEGMSNKPLLHIPTDQYGG